MSGGSEPYRLWSRDWADVSRGRFDTSRFSANSNAAPHCSCMCLRRTTHWACIHKHGLLFH